jgi:hypothetical protein
MTAAVVRSEVLEARSAARAAKGVTVEGTVDAAAAVDKAWPAPDLSMFSPQRDMAPSFPHELFGPFWSEWIAAAAESKGAPPDYVAGPLLSAAEALLANVRRASPWPGWVEPPIIWTANVGNPSSGKSPALDAITDLVRAIEAELDRDYEDRRRSHAMAAELAKVRRQQWEHDV